MSDRDEAKEKKVKLKSTVGNFNSKVNIVIMVLGSLFASRAQSFSIFSIIFIYIFFSLPIQPYRSVDVFSFYLA